MGGAGRGARAGEKVVVEGGCGVAAAEEVERLLEGAWLGFVDGCTAGANGAVAKWRDEGKLPRANV
jgi:hypothetical protein